GPSTFGGYLLSLYRQFPALGWILLFWLVYLVVNDLRRNQKIWKHGLIATLHRAFTARNLQQPLPVKTARRNGIAFASAAVYGLLMLAGGIIGYVQGDHSGGDVWGMGSLFFLLLVGFLILQYRIGVKNMETARDLETLTNRIRDIRSGNYAGNRDGSGNESFAGSNIENGIDTAGEYGQNKNSSLASHDLEDTMAQLEDIRHGMANAVDEQMKSERMKVELIANVSHDIKTPLTSIISYVQFLKEEKELPEHVQDYVKILDEKSQRLKNMVQDVFAVSKAASGELPMQMEELDFCKLLRQTLADMEEQIEGSKVSFRTEIPESPVMITADGQRMYRVFQNLFQNAIQYSLDGSRVFVTLQTDGATAVASVKNTSHLELEKDKDFTERFTRGDQSRTDGGSGLGLSIAQSFTEACGGSFHWETNADLFVVTVSFPSTMTATAK
ncbi:MAG: HAMP domain-containing histidine kinase, partial [Acetatifactor sp.]|nr:HAMP domain-containing histidine kinase [Acetatifactor sp.]